MRSTAGLLNATLDRLASTQLGLSGAQEGVSAGFSVSSGCSNSHKQWKCISHNVEAQDTVL